MVNTRATAASHKAQSTDKISVVTMTIPGVETTMPPISVREKARRLLFPVRKKILLSSIYNVTCVLDSKIEWSNFRLYRDRNISFVGVP